MPVTDSEILKINQLFKENSDKEYLESIKVLVPSGKKIIGVRVPEIRQFVKEYQKTKKPDYEYIIELTDRLIKRQIREEMLFGIFLLHKNKQYDTNDLFTKIDQWIEYIENWEICDQLAIVAADVISRNTELFNRLDEWTGSDNFWRRRFVLSAGSALNHKGRSNVKEVLSLCSKLMTDSEPMVARALPWAIREASKKDEKLVFEFLKQWKNKIPKNILKASSEKLPDQLIKKLLD